MYLARSASISENRIRKITTIREIVVELIVLYRAFLYIKLFYLLFTIRVFCPDMPITTISLPKVIDSSSSVTASSSE